MSSHALEQRLEAAPARRLARAAAHELNNILTALMGYVEMGRLEPPDQAGFYFDCLAEACRRLQSYSGDLALYAERNCPSGFEFSVLPVLQDLQAEFPALTLSVDPDLPELCAQPEPLLDCLSELCHNARRAGATECELAVRCRTLGPAECGRLETAGQPLLEFVVRDNGVGLEPGTASRMLEPHQRNPAWGGRGLGLSRVQGFAGYHGGWFELNGLAQGGCEARLCLPVAGRPEQCAD